MDGRGRVDDNIFVERLWRSVKYEEVYLRDYADGREAWAGLDAYVRFYNDERPHQARCWNSSRPTGSFHSSNRLTGRLS